MRLPRWLPRRCRRRFLRLVQQRLADVRAVSAQGGRNAALARAMQIADAPAKLFQASAAPLPIPVSLLPQLAVVRLVDHVVAPCCSLARRAPARRALARRGPA